MENSSSNYDPKLKLPNKDFWPFDQGFKEYLLLLASKGGQALENTDKYPKILEIKESWHDTLNQLREQTKKDHHEHWAFVGTKVDNKDIFLPTVPIKGNKGSIDSDVTEKMINWGKNQWGITNFLGDLHSHPHGAFTDLDDRITSIIKPNTFFSSFSVGDFYGFIHPSANLYFRGVADYDYNLFMIKTRESKNLGVDPQGMTQDNFTSYWYEAYGWKYLGTTKDGGESAKDIKGDHSIVDINKAIAKKHGLAIYQGKKNQNLAKVFPI